MTVRSAVSRSNAATGEQLVIIERGVASHTASISQRLDLQPCDDDNRRFSLSSRTSAVNLDDLLTCACGPLAAAGEHLLPARRHVAEHCARRIAPLVPPVHAG
jgi:hypothetical protein